MSGELDLIQRLTRDMPRSAYQVNDVHETDAELLALPQLGESVLAVTTDSISEEVALGIYTDPEEIGWMLAVANASDLAAVAADPIGLLVAGSFPSDFDIDSFTAGLREACVFHRMPLLGGDTNSADTLQTTGTAIGVVPKDQVITRVGSRPGDILFSSGPLGSGSAHAFCRLSKRSTLGPFKPQARLREGILLRSWASACIDTSDGLLVALDTLGSLNGVGFELSMHPGILTPSAQRVAEHAGIPEWLMLAGLHGEFALVFTIPPDRADSFEKHCRAQGWDALRLGAVTDCDVVIRESDGPFRVQVDRIRQVFDCFDGDVMHSIELLMQLRS